MRPWVFWTIAGVATVGAIAFIKRHEIMQTIWDKITERRINKLHPMIRDKVRAFIAAAQDQDIFLRITSGLRTWGEQQKLYDQGRTAESKEKKEPIVTQTKPGQSFHNYGLAFDVVEIKDGTALWDNPNWAKIGALGKTFGFEWGGEWSGFQDLPHFEYPPGVPASKLLSFYNSGKLDANGYLTQIS